MWLTGIEMLFLKFILVTGRNVPDPDKIVGWTITPASARYRPAKELNRVHILIMMILIIITLSLFRFISILVSYWSNTFKRQAMQLKEYKLLKREQLQKLTAWLPVKQKQSRRVAEKQIPQILESEIHGVKSLTEGMIRKSPLVKVEE